MRDITIRDSLYFSFDGVKSKTINMLNVSLDGGMQSEYFGSSQTINEDNVRGRTKPYYQGVKKDPLKVSVHFAFEDQWDRDELRYVRRWLTEPTDYVPLYFSNDPEKIYYVIYTDEPELLHNSLSQGYITLNFRCNDAYAYSPLTTSPVYEWDKSNYTERVTDFSQGIKDSLIIDQNEHLILNPQRIKWSDFPSGTKLSDLQ